MKRYVLSVIVASVFATGLVAAQSQGNPPSQPQPQTQKAPEAVLTGCVIQGSSPTVFILDAARTNPQDRNEKARTFVLVAGTEDLQLKNHLNHEVRITGVAENKTPPTPPAGQKVAEKDLPKLTAKSITMVADRCTTTLAR